MERMPEYQLPDGWVLCENALERNFTFSDFNEAFDFMKKVALVCEEMNHHPDWSNAYHKLKIRLFTHDKNQITRKDYELAQAINALV